MKNEKLIIVVALIFVMIMSEIVMGFPLFNFLLRSLGII